jgi:arylsulfatase A-like enzyme
MPVALACGDSGFVDVPRKDPNAAGGKQRPNVLVIVVDTLRRDHLGLYGYRRPTSATLDKLASDGIVYERAFSQASWTTPSIGSLLSSKFPSELGITDTPSRLGDDVALLPEILQSSGYVTAAVVSHFFVNRRWNFDQGFDYFNDRHIHGHSGISSPQVSASAVDFLQIYGAMYRSSGEHPPPFFLFLHYFDPHHDYIEHEGFRFTETREVPARLRGENDFNRIFWELGPTLTEADVDYLEALYDSEIAFTDFHLDSVIQQLKKLRLYDDTLIVFTADHGEELRDHGAFEHALSLYNEQIWVPLLLKPPGSRAGARLAVNVGLVDVVPTILEQSGIEVQGDFAGRTLPLSDEAAENRGEVPIFSETSRKGIEIRSVVLGDHKLIHYLHPRGAPHAVIPEGPGPEQRYGLFDLNADPRERKDLRAVLPGRFAELKSHLDRFEARPSSVRAEQVELAPHERSALEALGYLDRSEPARETP